MNRIFAIAHNTLKQGIRLKISLIIILFLILVVIGFPFAVQSDGTQKGRIQIILVYSISLAGFLLSVLTIFLSTTTMCKDISSHQIMTVDIKPVRRYEILIGKWLGIMFLNMFLVFCMGCVMYFVIKIAQKIPAKETSAMHSAADILISRKKFMPQPMDIEKLVEREIEQRKKYSEIPPGVTEEKLRHNLRRAIERSVRAVPPNYETEWIIKGIKSPKGDIVARYKFHTGRPLTETGQKQQLIGVWTAGKREKGNFVEIPVSNAADVFHQIYIPREVLDNDTLYLSYANIDPLNITVLFPVHDGVEVMAPVGGFSFNFFKGLLLLLIGIAFISTIGIITGSIFSFPTAIAVCIFIYGLSLSTGFVRELAFMEAHQCPGCPAHTHTEEQKPVGIGANVLGDISRYFFKGILLLIPDINKTNPSGYLSTGIFISFFDVLRQFFSIIMLRVIPLFLAGFYFFYRREIALGDTSM
ncbi:hypothetical protein B9J78_05090 [bacterium Unc6]|nr:hypothetical protein [bacterium Unc6]